MRKLKSACNKSCRSSHKDSRTVEFAFFRFIYKFISILQIRCYWKVKRKRKRNFAVRPLEVFVSKQSGPWPDLEQGMVGRPDFGKETHWRRGVGGGKGRGRRGAPVGGLRARGDGRTGLAGGTVEGRRWLAAAAALRREKGGELELVSTSGGWRCRSRARLGWREAGGWGSPWRVGGHGGHRWWCSCSGEGRGLSGCPAAWEGRLGGGQHT